MVFCSWRGLSLSLLHNALINGRITHPDQSPFHWIHVVITTLPRRPTNTKSQALRRRAVKRCDRSVSNCNETEDEKCATTPLHWDWLDYSSSGSEEECSLKGCVCVIICRCFLDLIESVRRHIVKGLYQEILWYHFLFLKLMRAYCDFMVSLESEKQTTTNMQIVQCTQLFGEKHLKSILLLILMEKLK